MQRTILANEIRVLQQTQTKIIDRFAIVLFSLLQLHYYDKERDVVNVVKSITWRKKSCWRLELI